MNNQRPKSIDGLMRYLRDTKKMSISGSSQKRRLMNMGYYHGYKGYRYINSPSNHVTYTKFEELEAIYSFDAKLKALFYPQVMFIETAVKNYVLDILVSMTHSNSFNEIYNKLLDNYKMVPPGDYKKELKNRLDLRNRIYRIQTDSFWKGNKIANHFLQKDLNLPIWAIFELLSFGDFGNFVSCLNKGCRTNVSIQLEIRQSDDTNAKMPERLIFTTRDLRNAIAHNDVIFDCRFKSKNIDKQVGNAITNATGVIGLSFNTITDYLVLIIYQLKLLHASKTEMKQMLDKFETIVQQLHNNVSTSVFNQIIYTDNKLKIAQLKKCI